MVPLVNDYYIIIASAAVSPISKPDPIPTMDDIDIFESLGGSLLNDLLADLNAAAVASDDNKGAAAAQQHSNKFHIDDSPDDLFALLEQELMSTYADPLPSQNPHTSSRLLLGDMQGNNYSVSSSSAAMVVNQHASKSGVVSTDNKTEDVWTNSLSQFGSMSLAADFLAADTAKKQQTQQKQVEKQRVNQLDESLFDKQGDYQLEEDVVYGNTAITTLLAEAPLRTKGYPTTETTKIMTPSSSGTAETTHAQPPPPPHTHPAMLSPPPPQMTGFLMPAPPPPLTAAIINNGVPVLSPQPMILNQMLLPPVLPVMRIPPHLQNRGAVGGAGPVPFDSDDFPALGSASKGQENPNESKIVSATTMAARPEINNNNIVATTTITTSEAQIIFNNTNPHTLPISALLIQSKLMPFRDICFIVNVMMRTLKSLDVYNDDYYHWSVLNRTSNLNNPPHLLARMPGAMAPPTLQPAPLLKGLKETVKVQEEAFQKAVKDRAKTFAEEQKSLGQLVRTNVKRPKALLDTPVLKKEENSEDSAATTATTTPDTKYEAGQQVSRIHLWRARVIIDRGYTAFLSLMEVRRLIQAQVRNPRVIQELMIDVKSNIDLLHSSLGVSVQVNAEGSKTIKIDKMRLSTTLSLPKGRILCARSIEEGIVPHPSACNLLPVALQAIFSEPMPSDGEDRLLHAFTGLILTENPGVHGEILCSCLEVVTSFAARENANDNGITSTSSSSSSLTSSHMRMNLLHGLLSMGKHVCVGSPILNKVWLEREKVFRDMLNLS